MPITQLDQNAALVVIDLQKGILGMETAPFSAQDVLQRSAQLASAFRERKLPVVLVNVDGRAPGRTDEGAPNFSFPPDWMELAPELAARPDDILITKQRWGAFLGTALHEELQKRGVTQLVMTGVATSVGVESTARSGYDLGYHIVFVSDAMTDRNETGHNARIEKLFPKMGEVDETANVLKLLQTPAVV